MATKRAGPSDASSVLAVEPGEAMRLQVLSDLHRDSVYDVVFTASLNRVPNAAEGVVD
jgi:hypothetical protein